jgi:holo-[acyl-carrier protein] synthase
LEYEVSPSLSVGVDMVSVTRIEGVLARHGARFLERTYTAGEQAYCQGRPSALAARFAAKEAVAKALGTGFGQVAWREIEIIAGERKEPLVQLHGNAMERARELGLRQFAVSLAHERDMAIAFVVAT